MQYKTLNNGIKMPLLGYGVFQIPDHTKCEEVVLEALRVGYRLIDTASIYLNEEAVGRAISKSGVPRSEIFLTTKLWVQDMSYEGAKAALERSLKRLGTDYVDLYLLHQPYGDYHGAWRALEEFYAEGKVKAIGVSNFSPARLVDLISHHKVIPAVNQIETHPFAQRIDEQKYMETKGIQIESWGPFAEAQYNIFKNETLTKIANAYNKTTAQVILRWLLQREIIAIPKSEKPERIAQNFDIFDFELSNEDMKDIAALDKAYPVISDHENDPVFAQMIINYKGNI